MKILLHPEADEEFIGAIRYYTQISANLGVRFYWEMDRLFRDISSHPDQYHQFDPPARRHFSHVFPYAIIYLEKPDSLWIVAVMHMKRRPGYWRERL